eukprot:scaffold623746_cov47-Attheya_sp.AAC.1
MPQNYLSQAPAEVPFAPLPDFDILEVMLRQEATTYQCPDYLGQMRHAEEELEDVPGEERQPQVEARARQMEMRREQIIEWIYQVIDQCDLPREIVAIATNLLDRYVAKRIAAAPQGGVANAVNGFTYQLAALTALYLTVKLNDHRKIRIERLVPLSSGRFTTKNIEDMERSMIESLGWFVHPPTSVSFVRELVTLGLPGLDASLRAHILCVSAFFTELSLLDYDLSVASTSSSTIAYAAILNAMDTVGTHRLDHDSRRVFIERIAATCGPSFSPQDENVFAVRQRLNEIDIQGAETSEHHSYHEDQMERLHGSSPSPRNVVDGVDQQSFSTPCPREIHP